MAIVSLLPFLCQIDLFEQVDCTNRELSDLYRDMHDIRMTVADMRALAVLDQAAYDKLVAQQVQGYKDVRELGVELRNKVRMDRGIPFDEPLGFDIMP